MKKFFIFIIIIITLIIGIFSLGYYKNIQNSDPIFIGNPSCLQLKQNIVTNNDNLSVYSQKKCVGLTIKLNKNTFYLNNSVIIYENITNLYPHDKLTLFGSLNFNITNSLNQSVYDIGLNWPCASPCYNTAMKIAPGETFSYRSFKWVVNNDSNFNYSVFSNSTYYITGQLKLTNEKNQNLILNSQQLKISIL